MESSRILSVKFLAVTAGFHCVHHNVFSGHERKFRHQTLLDDFRIYDESVYNVQAEVQNAVDGEKNLPECSASC